MSLCDTAIDELPEETGELQYLQTLDVRGSGIKELPSSVGRLARLATLLCDFEVRVPDGFGRNMQALQRLECTKVFVQLHSFAQGLRQLRNLQILEVTIVVDHVPLNARLDTRLGARSSSKFFFSGIWMHPHHGFRTV